MSYSVANTFGISSVFSSFFTFPTLPPNSIHYTFNKSPLEQFFPISPSVVSAIFSNKNIFVLWFQSSASFSSELETSQLFVKLLLLVQPIESFACFGLISNQINYFPIKNGEKQFPIKKPETINLFMTSHRELHVHGG